MQKLGIVAPDGGGDRRPMARSWRGHGICHRFCASPQREPAPAAPPSPQGHIRQSIKFEAICAQIENVDRLRIFANGNRPNATRPSVVRNGAGSGRMAGRSKSKPIRAHATRSTRENPKCAGMLVSRSQPLPPPFWLECPTSYRSNRQRTLPTGNPRHRELMHLSSWWLRTTFPASGTRSTGPAVRERIRTLRQRD